MSVSVAAGAKFDEKSPKKCRISNDHDERGWRGGHLGIKKKRK